MEAQKQRSAPKLYLDCIPVAVPGALACVSVLHTIPLLLVPGLHTQLWLWRNYCKFSKGVNFF